MSPVVVAVAGVAVTACGEQPGPADANRYSAELQALNGSGVEGRARFDLEGQHLTVRIKADGLARNRIHEQGIYGFVGERREAQCSEGAAEEAQLRAEDEPEPGAGEQDRLGAEEEALLGAGEGLIGGDEESEPEATQDTRPYGSRLRQLEPFPTVGSKGSLNYKLTFNVEPERLEPLNTRAVVLRGASEGSEYRPDEPVACGNIQLVATPEDARRSAR